MYLVTLICRRQLTQNIFKLQKGERKTYFMCSESLGVGAWDFGSFHQRSCQIIVIIMPVMSAIIEFHSGPYFQVEI